jgi:hypothetical protein
VDIGIWIFEAELEVERQREDLYKMKTGRQHISSKFYINDNHSPVVGDEA